MNRELEQNIFDSTIDFFERAKQVFDFQYQNNQLYQDFCRYLSVHPNQINQLEDIPFLPIECFKSHQIISNSLQAKLIFRSSRTTSQTASEHYVAEPKIYEQAIAQGFEQQFGSISNYCIVALLPSYFERNDASLVYMTDYLMTCSSHPRNGYYLHNYEELAKTLHDLEEMRQATILLGVSFALLDFAAAYPMQLNHTKIIETGGMKGRRKEITREQLHSILHSAFQSEHIYSEYGMTELLSQAYFDERKSFLPAHTMRVLIREISDPLSYMPIGKSGAINVVDLANLYSCSFIATQDIGKRIDKSRFQVLGRTDNSDLRGCNLMVF